MQEATLAAAGSSALPKPPLQPPAIAGPTSSSSSCASSATFSAAAARLTASSSLLPGGPLAVDPLPLHHHHPHQQRPQHEQRPQPFDTQRRVSSSSSSVATAAAAGSPPPVLVSPELLQLLPSSGSPTRTPPSPSLSSSSSTTPAAAAATSRHVGATRLPTVLPAHLLQHIQQHQQGQQVGCQPAATVAAVNPDHIPRRFLAAQAYYKLQQEQQQQQLRDRLLYNDQHNDEGKAGRGHQLSSFALSAASSSIDIHSLAAAKGAGGTLELTGHCVEEGYSKQIDALDLPSAPLKFGPGFDSCSSATSGAGGVLTRSNILPSTPPSRSRSPRPASSASAAAAGMVASSRSSRSASVQSSNASNASPSPTPTLKRPTGDGRQAHATPLSLVAAASQRWGAFLSGVRSPFGGSVSSVAAAAAAAAVAGATPEPHTTIDPQRSPAKFTQPRRGSKTEANGDSDRGGERSQSVAATMTTGHRDGACRDGGQRRVRAASASPLGRGVPVVDQPHRVDDSGERRATAHTTGCSKYSEERAIDVGFELMAVADIATNGSSEANASVRSNAGDGGTLAVHGGSSPRPTRNQASKPIQQHQQQRQHPQLSSLPSAPCPTESAQSGQKTMMTTPLAGSDNHQPVPFPRRTRRDQTSRQARQPLAAGANDGSVRARLSGVHVEGVTTLRPNETSGWTSTVSGRNERLRSISPAGSDAGSRNSEESVIFRRVTIKKKLDPSNLSRASDSNLLSKRMAGATLDDDGQNDDHYPPLATAAITPAAGVSGPARPGLICRQAVVGVGAPLETVSPCTSSVEPLKSRLSCPSSPQLSRLLMQQQQQHQQLLLVPAAPCALSNRYPDLVLTSSSLIQQQQQQQLAGNGFAAGDDQDDLRSSTSTLHSTVDLDSNCSASPMIRRLQAQIRARASFRLACAAPLSASSEDDRDATLTRVCDAPLSSEQPAPLPVPNASQERILPEDFRLVFISSSSSSSSDGSLYSSSSSLCSVSLTTDRSDVGLRQPQISGLLNQDVASAEKHKTGKKKRKKRSKRRKRSTLKVKSRLEFGSGACYIEDSEWEVTSDSECVRMAASLGSLDEISDVEEIVKEKVKIIEKKSASLEDLPGLFVRAGSVRLKRNNSVRRSVRNSIRLRNNPLLLTKHLRRPPHIDGDRLANRECRRCGGVKGDHGLAAVALLTKSQLVSGRSVPPDAIPVPPAGGALSKSANVTTPRPQSPAATADTAGVAAVGDVNRAINGGDDAAHGALTYRAVSNCDYALLAGEDELPGRLHEPSTGCHQGLSERNGLEQDDHRHHWCAPHPRQQELLADSVFQGQILQFAEQSQPIVELQPTPARDTTPPGSKTSSGQLPAASSDVDCRRRDGSMPPSPSSGRRRPASEIDDECSVRRVTHANRERADADELTDHQPGAVAVATAAAAVTGVEPAAAAVAVSTASYVDKRLVPSADDDRHGAGCHRLAEKSICVRLGVDCHKKDNDAAPSSLTAAEQATGVGYSAPNVMTSRKESDMQRVSSPLAYNCQSRKRQEQQQQKHDSHEHLAQFEGRQTRSWQPACAASCTDNSGAKHCSARCYGGDQGEEDDCRKQNRSFATVPPLSATNGLGCCHARARTTIDLHEPDTDGVPNIIEKQPRLDAHVHEAVTCVAAVASPAQLDAVVCVGTNAAERDVSDSLADAASARVENTSNNNSRDRAEEGTLAACDAYEPQQLSAAADTVSEALHAPTPSLAAASLLFDDNHVCASAKAASAAAPLAGGIDKVHLAGADPSVIGEPCRNGNGTRRSEDLVDSHGEHDANRPVARESRVVHRPVACSVTSHQRLQPPQLLQPSLQPQQQQQRQQQQQLQKPRTCRSAQQDFNNPDVRGQLDRHASSSTYVAATTDSAANAGSSAERAAHSTAHRPDKCQAHQMRDDSSIAVGPLSLLEEHCRSQPTAIALTQPARSEHSAVIADGCWSLSRWSYTDCSTPNLLAARERLATSDAVLPSQTDISRWHVDAEELGCSSEPTVTGSQPAVSTNASDNQRKESDFLSASSRFEAKTDGEFAVEGNEFHLNSLKVSERDADVVDVRPKDNLSNDFPQLSEHDFRSTEPIQPTKTKISDQPVLSVDDVEAQRRVQLSQLQRNQCQQPLLRDIQKKQSQQQQQQRVSSNRLSLTDVVARRVASQTVADQSVSINLHNDERCAESEVTTRAAAPTDPTPASAGDSELTFEDATRAACGRHTIKRDSGSCDTCEGVTSRATAGVAAASGRHVVSDGHHEAAGGPAYNQLTMAPETRLASDGNVVQMTPPLLPPSLPSLSAALFQVQRQGGTRGLSAQAAAAACSPVGSAGGVRLALAAVTEGFADVGASGSDRSSWPAADGAANRAAIAAAVERGVSCRPQATAETASVAPSGRRGDAGKIASTGNTCDSGKSSSSVSNSTNSTNRSSSLTRAPWPDPRLALTVVAAAVAGGQFESHRPAREATTLANRSGGEIDNDGDSSRVIAGSIGNAGADVGHAFEPDASSGARTAGGCGLAACEVRSNTADASAKLRDTFLTTGCSRQDVSETAIAAVAAAASAAGGQSYVADRVRAGNTPLPKPVGHRFLLDNGLVETEQDCDVRAALTKESLDACLGESSLLCFSQDYCALNGVLSTAGDYGDRADSNRCGVEVPVNKYNHGVVDAVNDSENSPYHKEVGKLNRSLLLTAKVGATDPVELLGLNKHVSKQLKIRPERAESAETDKRAAFTKAPSLLSLTEITKDSGDWRTTDQLSYASRPDDDTSGESAGNSTVVSSLERYFTEELLIPHQNFNCLDEDYLSDDCCADSLAAPAQTLLIDEADLSDVSTSSDDLFALEVAPNVATVAAAVGRSVDPGQPCGAQATSVPTMYGNPHAFSLHTIVEDSCEESEQSAPSSPQTRREPSELEQYFSYAIGSTTDNDDDDQKRWSVVSEDLSDSVSEASYVSEVVDEDPSLLASSRLEKYFTNLVGGGCYVETTGKNARDSLLEQNSSECLPPSNEAVDDTGRPTTDNDVGLGSGCFEEETFNTIKRNKKATRGDSESNTSLAPCRSTESIVDRSDDAKCNSHTSDPLDTEQSTAAAIVLDVPGHKDERLAVTPGHVSAVAARYSCSGGVSTDSVLRLGIDRSAAAGLQQRAVTAYPSERHARDCAREDSEDDHVAKMDIDDFDDEADEDEADMAKVVDVVEKTPSPEQPALGGGDEVDAGRGLAKARAAAAALAPLNALRLAEQLENIALTGKMKKISSPFRATGEQASGQDSARSADSPSTVIAAGSSVSANFSPASSSEPVVVTGPGSCIEAETCRNVDEPQSPVQVSVKDRVSKLNSESGAVAAAFSFGKKAASPVEAGGRPVAAGVITAAAPIVSATAGSGGLPKVAPRTLSVKKSSPVVAPNKPQQQAKSSSETALADDEVVYVVSRVMAHISGTAGAATGNDHHHHQQQQQQQLQLPQQQQQHGQPTGVRLPAFAERGGQACSSPTWKDLLEDQITSLMQNVSPAVAGSCLITRGAAMGGGSSTAASSSNNSDYGSDTLESEEFMPFSDIEKRNNTKNAQLAGSPKEALSDETLCICKRLMTSLKQLSSKSPSPPLVNEYAKAQEYIQDQIVALMHTVTASRHGSPTPLLKDGLYQQQQQQQQLQHLQQLQQPTQQQLSAVTQGGLGDDDTAAGRRFKKAPVPLPQQQGSPQLYEKQSESGSETVSASISIPSYDSDETSAPETEPVNGDEMEELYDMLSDNASLSGRICSDGDADRRPATDFDGVSSPLTRRASASASRRSVVAGSRKPQTAASTTAAATAGQVVATVATRVKTPPPPASAALLPLQVIRIASPPGKCDSSSTLATSSDTEFSGSAETVLDVATAAAAPSASFGLAVDSRVLQVLHPLAARESRAAASETEDDGDPDRRLTGDISRSDPSLYVTKPTRLTPVVSGRRPVSADDDVAAGRAATDSPDKRSPQYVGKLNGDADRHNRLVNVDGTSTAGRTFNRISSTSRPNHGVSRMLALSKVKLSPSKSDCFIAGVLTGGDQRATTPPAAYSREAAAVSVTKSLSEHNLLARATNDYCQSLSADSSPATLAVTSVASAGIKSAQSENNILDGHCRRSARDAGCKNSSTRGSEESVDRPGAGGLMKADATRPTRDSAAKSNGSPLGTRDGQPRDTGPASATSDWRQKTSEVIDFERDSEPVRPARSARAGGSRGLSVAAAATGVQSNLGESSLSATGVRLTASVAGGGVPHALSTPNIHETFANSRFSTLPLKPKRHAASASFGRSAEAPITSMSSSPSSATAFDGRPSPTVRDRQFSTALFSTSAVLRKLTLKADDASSGSQPSAAGSAAAAATTAALRSARYRGTAVTATAAAAAAAASQTPSAARNRFGVDGTSGSAERDESAEASRGSLASSALSKSHTSLLSLEPAPSLANVAHLQHPSARSESMSSVYSAAGGGRVSAVAVTGEINFGLSYDLRQGLLNVHVREAKNLAAVDERRNRSDPYVKVYLLPDRSKAGKRKTKVRRHTLNPVFNEMLRFAVDRDELTFRTLWLSVWHSDMFGRNDFLGEVMKDLSSDMLETNTSHWYPLQERVDSADLGLMPGGAGSLASGLSGGYRGELMLSLKWAPHDHRPGRGSLHVIVKEASNLHATRSNGTSDPFCKCYLLPDRHKTGKQKTAVVRRSVSPVWNHPFVYHDVSLAELRERALELTIWDYDKITSNDYLGGVRLSLGTGKYQGSTVDWMDSQGEEIRLWRQMLDKPSQWIDGCLLLRASMT